MMTRKALLCAWTRLCVCYCYVHYCYVQGLLTRDRIEFSAISIGTTLIEYDTSHLNKPHLCSS